MDRNTEWDVAPRGESSDGDADSFHVGFWNVLRLLRRRKGTVVSVGLVGLAMGLAARFPHAPEYRTVTAVEVQSSGEEIGFSRDANPGASFANMYPDMDLATQAQVMKSKILQDRVIAKLVSDRQLTVRIPRDRVESMLEAIHLSSKPALKPSANQSAGQPANDAVRLEMITDAVQSMNVAAARKSRIIEITCQSTDPVLAATVCDTIATEYIDQSLESRWQSAKHTGEWLGRQMQDMKLKLEKSEEQLQGYAAAMSLIVTGSKENRNNVSDEKLRQVQSELSAAEADRVAKQARYEMATSSRKESLGQVLDDQSLRTYDSKLSDLRKELADLATTLTPAHYKVKKVQAQIAELEASEKSARDRVVERIYNDYREAERREKLLSAQFGTQAALVSNEAGKLIHYNLLEREVETNRQLYESLLQKVKEAAIGAALRASNVRVVDPAQVPKTPFSPDYRLASIVGLLLGLMSGVAVAVVQEKVSRSIEVPADALFYLNVPLLGAVPARSIDESRGSRWQLSGQRSSQGVLTEFGGQRSAMAEAFRAILTSMLFAGRRQPAQVVVVGSPGASEGKTTVSCNLALAFAEAGRSVLLIDCDLRRPRLHDVFNVSNDFALAGLLAGKDPIDARAMFVHLHGTDNSGVTVLPSGQLDAGAANLLHSRRFEELVAFARRHFDIVLLDTPPMLQLADARIVGSHADGVVLVVRAGQTMRDSAVAARQQLGEDGIPVIGMVLNDWDPKSVGYYGYEYYGNSYYQKTPRAEQISA